LQPQTGFGPLVSYGCAVRRCGMAVRAALERRKGLLTMELDLPKRGLVAAPSTSRVRSLITSGAGDVSAGREYRVIGLRLSTCYRRPREGNAQESDADADLRTAIDQIQRDFPRYAYRGITRARPPRPHRANHKRV
jgi:hypothetical protein